jgi:hypothetical protein
MSGCAPVSEPTKLVIFCYLSWKSRLTNANNGKTLMHEDGALTNIASGPVWAAMTLLLGERNEL